MTLSIEEMRRRRALAKKPVNSQFGFRINRHQQFLKQQREKGDRNREALAEYMAEHGGSVSAAARALGMSAGTALKHWRTICEGLGDQAV
jgi:molybdenum-dependent DNA-binding transcriptional regulator ModE